MLGAAKRSSILSRRVDYRALAIGTLHGPTRAPRANRVTVNIDRSTPTDCDGKCCGDASHRGPASLLKVTFSRLRITRRSGSSKLVVIYIRKEVPANARELTVKVRHRNSECSRRKRGKNSRCDATLRVMSNSREPDGEKLRGGRETDSDRELECDCQEKCPICFVLQVLRNKYERAQSSINEIQVFAAIDERKRRCDRGGCSHG